MNIKDATPIARAFAWLHGSALPERPGWQRKDAYALAIDMLRDLGERDIATALERRAAGDARRLAWVGNGLIEVIE